MNKTNAQKLLKRIRAEKSAELGDSLGDTLRQQVNQQMQNDAIKTILKTVALSAGAGAAFRGAMGFSDFSQVSKKGPRVVEMPVIYPKEKDKTLPKPEKTAIDSNARATAPHGLDYYLPSLLVGAPLAAYGGWKGVDFILSNAREQESKAKLEASKKKYEEALLGSYKTATDGYLDRAFVGYAQKVAFDPIGATSAAFNSTFPNASGLGKGLALTYLLASVPAGYFLVNKAMKKNSRNKILEEAVAERARRQAIAQPPELYAVPHSI